MYAIIEAGGKQYRVREGDVLRLEKIAAEAGALVPVTRVLALATEDAFLVGRPTVAGARVVLRVLAHGRGEKIVVFKYKPKKNYRRKKGHRQDYTQVRVEKIELEGGVADGTQEGSR
ncbi:MAG: 50S ribosomal protein L21 [Firmicutes bacterium]|nr:50S ribosomal protein L21 [Bacillota bacterium]